MSTLSKLIERLKSEAESNAADPHPPVKGCVHVMPLIAMEHGGKWIELQFNGYAVRLFATGEWEYVDTAEEMSLGVDTSKLTTGESQTNS